jgi:outer membrane phospholipase A
MAQHPPPEHSRSTDTTDSLVANPDMENMGISETMRREDAEIAKRLAKEEERHDAEMAEKRKAIVEEGSSAADKKFKALEHLLNQSKVSHYHAQCRNYQF